MSGEELKTRGMLPGYFYEFKGDEDSCDLAVLLEVTEVIESGELEIAWSVEKYRHHLRFRLKDLQKAAREKSEVA